VRVRPVITALATGILAIAVGVVSVSADPGHGKGSPKPPPYPPASPSVVVSNSNPKVNSNIKVWYNGCQAGDTVTFTLNGYTRTRVVKTTIRYEKDYSVYVELKVPATPGPYTGSVTCSSGRTASFSITAVIRYACSTGVPSGKESRSGRGDDCCPLGGPSSMSDRECDRALLDALMKKYDWLVD
jgi:hypothetical protein